MSEKPIQCEAHFSSDDMQTRWSCQNAALYKVGIPTESLVRYYVCADHVFMALHALGKGAIAFDLRTRRVVNPERIRPLDASGVELPIPPGNKPFGMIVFHFTRLRPYDVPEIRSKVERALKEHDLTQNFTITLGWLAHADYTFLGYWPDGCTARAIDSVTIFARNGELENGQ